MDEIAIVNLIAIVVGPVAAVIITLWHQTRTERYRNRLVLFSTLVANRHVPLTNDNIRALNLVDSIFHDKPLIRQLWHKYYEMLDPPPGSSELFFQSRKRAYRDLLLEMSRCLGLGHSLSHKDIEREYVPQIVSDQEQLQQAIQLELLKALNYSNKASQLKDVPNQPTSIVETKPMESVYSHDTVVQNATQ